MFSGCTDMPSLHLAFLSKVIQFFHNIVAHKTTLLQHLQHYTLKVSYCCMQTEYISSLKVSLL